MIGLTHQRGYVFRLSYRSSRRPFGREEGRWLGEWIEKRRRVVKLRESFLRGPQTKKNPEVAGVFLEPITGIEPMTCALRMHCSTN